MLDPEAHCRPNAIGEARYLVRIRYKVSAVGAINGSILCGERRIIRSARNLNKAAPAKPPTIPAGNVSIPNPVCVGFVGNLLLVGRPDDLPGCRVPGIRILLSFSRMEPVIAEHLQSFGVIVQVLNLRLHFWSSFLHDLCEKVRAPERCIEPILA